MWPTPDWLLLESLLVTARGPSGTAPETETPLVHHFTTLCPELFKVIRRASRSYAVIYLGLEALSCDLNFGHRTIT